MASVLSALAETDPDLLLVTSDSRGSGKVTGFAQKFKGRDLKGEIVAVKIIESNTFSLIGELL